MVMTGNLEDSSIQKRMTWIKRTAKRKGVILPMKMTLAAGMIEELVPLKIL